MQTIETKQYLLYHYVLFKAYKYKTCLKSFWVLRRESIIQNVEVHSDSAYIVILYTITAWHHMFEHASFLYKTLHCIYYIYFLLWSLPNKVVVTAASVTVGHTFIFIFFFFLLM